MKRHRRHERVEDDLRRASRWYERKVPGLGERFLDAAESGIEEILSNPQGWSRLAGVTQNLEIRHYLLFPPFPYYVAYLVDDDGKPFILAVAHSKRLPSFWLRRIRRPRVR